MQDVASVPLPGGEWSLATRLMHPRQPLPDPFHATVAPLYQTATFQQVLPSGLVLLKAQPHGALQPSRQQGCCWQLQTLAAGGARQSLPVRDSVTSPDRL